MSKVPLTLAISKYDHVGDLLSGDVKVEGVDLLPLTLPLEEIFFRFLRFKEWDASELSLAKYVALRASGDTTFTAIPVFPSRMFRHSSIFVRANGPTKPADLAGARIGVPEWAQTASIYTRAILTHDFGIPLTQVHWFQAGVNEHGRAEKVEIYLPDGVELTRVTDRSLDEMLCAGELDAAFSAHVPASFERGEGHIRRLFADYESVEREYAERTGIFPIMHVVAIRTAVLEANPWIAMNLFEAFEESKRRWLERLHTMTISATPIPWISERLKALESISHGDWWPYGLEDNRRTLDAFVAWAYEQGVIGSRIDVESLFAKETLARYKV